MGELTMALDPVHLLDTQGFLIDYTAWTRQIGLAVAKQENIILSDDHWKVIDLVRTYYSVEKKSPAIRLLVRLLKKTYGEQIGNSLYLQQLFPVSPAVQVAKIAGLPKPKRCI